jgi:rare lipoprotein A
MKTLLLTLGLFAQAATLYAQTKADSIRATHKKKGTEKIETGVASYYHSKFQGRPTASGEKYDATKMTAAHNRLPFGTRIKVTNLRNKRSVIVRVNDRLHHRNTRLVDLSRAAAAKLGYVGRGLAKVKVEVLGRNSE